MQPIGYLGTCVLLLGAGLLTLANPVIPKAVHISEGVERSIRDQDATTQHINRDAKPEEADFWDILFPGLFPTSSAKSASPTSTTSTSSTTSVVQTPTSTDAAIALTYHNYARQDRGLNPLTWDTSLEAQAVAYAKQLALYGSFAHSDAATRAGQGENLAVVRPIIIFLSIVSNPLSAATNQWLVEARNYHNETLPEGNFNNYNRYTQMVWNTTTKVGMGAARNVIGAWYVVARYSPAGNVYGQKPY